MSATDLAGLNQHLNAYYKSSIQCISLIQLLLKQTQQDDLLASFAMHWQVAQARLLYLRRTRTPFGLVVMKHSAMPGE